MNIMNSSSLIDAFEVEAKTHIEIIESAFLDTDKFADNSALIDEVFRAAHSLKGTAGFFSYENIVAVAHELENIFSSIKDGKIIIDEEIADIVLQSVDYLNDLLEHLDNPDMSITKMLLKQLKSYSEIRLQENKEHVVHMPFDMKSPELASSLKKALERGQFVYHLNIEFNQSLGRYYLYPKGLIDEILSIGIIAIAALDGVIIESSEVIGSLAGRDTPVLDIIVFSVLEPKFFLIALELDSKYVHSLSEKFIMSGGGEKSLSAEQTINDEMEKAKISLQKSDFSIRLDVSVVNNLLDLANEMILTRNQLVASLGHEKAFASLKPLLNDLSRQTREMQEKVMGTRMQPISIVFAKFPRMIRNTAKELNKDIKIEIYGGEVTLDKYLLDALSDPITQLIKNSADHGIEPIQRRLALSKPRRGIITLKAYRSDGMAVIEVSDDGAGIDEEALKKKALESKIISEGQLSSMTRDDVFALIFMPGVSTAKEVTNISGRGVGMDIVKTNIEKMGGIIEIESEMEKGTTMRLKMPLTLSVIRTLIIKINSLKYAVPEINVERIVRVSKNKSAAQIEKIGTSYLLNLEGWLLPIITLDSKEILLNFQSIAKCLVLRANNKYFAVLIDEALETEETLINPMPIFLKNCGSYSNVTVLGSGDTAMVIDAEGLLAAQGIDGADKAAAIENGENSEDEQKSVLIFTCSGPEEFAIDESLVARIVRVAPQQIQEIGDKLFADIAGKTIQIIKPEDYAPVKKRDYQKDWLYLLLLNETLLPAAILAGRVLNKIKSAFTINNEHFENRYLLGSGVYADKIILFLNVGEILKSALSEGGV